MTKDIVGLVLFVQSRTHFPHPQPPVFQGAWSYHRDPLQPQARSLRAPSRLEVQPLKQDRGGSSDVFLSTPEVDVNVFGAATGRGGAIDFAHAPYVCTCVVLQGGGTG